MYLAIIIFGLLLIGCATTTTLLKNQQTGQVAQCGGDRSGSIMFGLIGYAVQQSDAEDCVNRYLGQGFDVINVGSAPSNTSDSNSEENDRDGIAPNPHN